MIAVVDPGIHGGPVIRELQAQHHVGLTDDAGGPAEMMGLGEVHAGALIDHRRLQQLGELNQKRNAVGRAGGAIDHDHGTLGIGEKLRRFAHCAGIALRRRGRHVTRDGELLAVLDRLLLQPGIERDCDRRIGRRHRDLISAHERLREVLERNRGIVPFGEITDQRIDVLRRMEGRHAGRALGGVEIVAADDDDRHPIAPCIVDSHAGVLQADRAVGERHHRLAGDLEIAVAHRHRTFLVGAGEELGLLVAAVIDQ